LDDRVISFPFIEVEVGHDRRDLDDDFLLDVEPRHFQIDPQQVFHGAIVSWKLRTGMDASEAHVCAHAPGAEHAPFKREAIGRAYGNFLGPLNSFPMNLKTLLSISCLIATTAIADGDVSSSPPVLYEASGAANIILSFPFAEGSDSLYSFNAGLARQVLNDDWQIATTTRFAKSGSFTRFSLAVGSVFNFGSDEFEQRFYAQALGGLAYPEVRPRFLLAL